MSIKTALLISIVAMLGLQVFSEPIGVSILCAGVPDDYFVRDLNDCKTYHYCRNETATTNKCPGDFYFNELEQICDYQDNVMCHICSEKTGVQILPHPQNCSQFITCSDGASFVSHCAEGYAFDKITKVCNPAKRVNCAPPSVPALCPEEDNPNEIVFLPSERCDEYFICQAGTPVLTLCAPGLYWDANNKRCDLKENVSCSLH